MNRTRENPKESKPTLRVKTYVIPIYLDEDPELTPERWWTRRRQQASSLL